MNRLPIQTAASELALALARDFPSTAPDPSLRIGAEGLFFDPNGAPHRYVSDDAEEAAAFFAGRAWTEISRGDLFRFDPKGTGSAEVTPEAFAYYLPAYLSSLSMSHRLLPAQLRFDVPPFTVGDPRPETLLRRLESLFPGQVLEWELQRVEKGQGDHGSRVKSVRIPERAPWLREKLRLGQTVLLSSDRGDAAITVSLELGARRKAADGTESCWVTLYLSASDGSDPMFAERIAICGDVLCAWHLSFMPSLVNVALFMSERSRLPPDTFRADLSGLPKLTPGVLPSALSPSELGWLNYWSEETARAIGFPDPSRDQEWLPLAQRTPRGAWIVKLTPEPFDVQRQDHVDALARAYRRFDRIGVRR